MLSNFLEVSWNDLKNSGNYSFNLFGDMDHEYFVLSEKDDSMEFLGQSEGFYIYKK